jgi:phosphoribosylglycinamide formyltransferase-1
MHLLAGGFLARFSAINVHPSLLPAFPGMRAVEEALAAGARETGVTVHFLDEGIDTGPVILQEAVPVLPDDSAETLHARLQEVEHRLLPEAARLYLAGALRSPAE